MVHVEAEMARDVLVCQNSWETSQEYPVHHLHNRGPGFLLSHSLRLVAQMQFQLLLVWVGAVFN